MTSHTIIRTAAACVLAGLASLTPAACADEAPDDAIDETIDDTIDDGGVDTSVPVDVDDVEPITVGDLLNGPSDGSNVVVSAVLLDDGSGVLMCEALAESYPPQCGGRSVGIRNPDAVDSDLVDVEFVEDQGVRWTDGPVWLIGWMDGDEFVLS